MNEEELAALAAQQAAEKAAAEAKAVADAAAKPNEKKGPTDEEARLLKEVMKKKEKVDELTVQVGQLNAVAKQLEELGGLEAVKALVTSKKDAELKDLESKGQWETLRARMAEENEKIVKAAVEKATTTEVALAQARLEIDNLTVGGAFANSKFIGEDMLNPPNKMRALYGSHFDRVDGQTVGYDKPRGEAGRAPIVGADGKALGFDEALKRIVDSDPDKDSLYKSKIRPGAASDSRRQTPGKTGPETSSMSGVERIAAGLAKLSKAA